MKMKTSRCRTLQRQPGCLLQTGSDLTYRPELRPLAIPVRIRGVSALKLRTDWTETIILDDEVWTVRSRFRVSRAELEGRRLPGRISVHDFLPGRYCACY